MNQPAGAAAGWLADRTLGEPPIDPHPVAAFGTVMGHIEGLLYPARKRLLAGGIHAAVGTGIGLSVGWLVSKVLGRSLATAISSYIAVAGRGLGDVASEIGRALAEDGLARARELLPSLVGRDPSQLDEQAIARAVVESVAENTVDAVVAPLLFAALAGAPGALAYRAINTMDAMVGYRNERYTQYGKASARLDDFVNYLPARLTAVAVAVLNPARTSDVWRAAVHDAKAHPSPNSGVAEGAFAAALGLQLGGLNVYGDTEQHRGLLGDGRPAEASDIAAAVQLSNQVGAVISGALLVIGWLRR